MQDNSNTFEKAPAPKVPDDFDDEADFLGHVRSLYDADTGADQENRDEEQLDAEFAAGKQWDEFVYQRRIDANKPTLTFNKLTAYIAQLVGNRRQNETAIKVIPDHAGSKEVAKIREGIIRKIQKSSAAKRAYDAAFQNQTIGGLGNFQVVVDYASDDVFEQEIKIEPIYDNLAVAWDYTCQDPTGSDARHVFVTEYLSDKEFEEKYPGKTSSNFSSDYGNSSRENMEGWYSQNRVRVADFWRIRSRKRTLALMQDGEVNDVTDMELSEYADNIVVRNDGSPVMRESNVKYAEMYRVSGADILEGPYDLPISRVPVFRCPGWEINTGQYKTRFGMVRFLRDPQRLYNYWRSVVAEKLIMTPKARWMAGKTAIEGYEDAFRRAHLSDDPLLVWNDEAAAKPELVQPVQVEAALINEAGMVAQDMRDISNLHEASFGQASNEVSGKAIMARQRVGELGNVIYLDNLNEAMKEAGRVINALIPHIYDTPRVVKVMMGDDAVDMQEVAINGADEGSIDISRGKYDITITTGPSTQTKRVETAEAMMAAVNAMPDVFGAAADLIAEAQDWPKSDQIASRLRNRMPPEMLGGELTPEQQQQQQMQAEKQQMAEELAVAEQRAKIAETEARAAQAQMQALKIRADMDKIDADIEKGEVDTAISYAKAKADIESQETRDYLETIDAITGENNVDGDG